jgi:hypothetical protein
VVVTFLEFKNWQTCVALLAGALSCNKKNLESRTQLDEPTECASGGDPLLLYKIPHLLFFPSGTNTLCTTPRKTKKLSTSSWCGTFRISVSSDEGMSHQPIQNSVALFRGHRQNTRSDLP